MTVKVNSNKEIRFEGNIVDVISESIYPGIITVRDRKIYKITKTDKSYKDYILPGFIDAHIHIESSLLCPSKFAEVVVPHGTVAVITDPHEIANVLGINGIEYMRKDASKTPLRVFFTAPSCVPSTLFETSGAILTSDRVERILKRKYVVALGEMMNFYGVINENSDMLKKIKIAKKYSKPIDGHAPLLSGSDLKKYISMGITTDHECTSLDEAREKATLGMSIMVREGSASKNLSTLYKILKEYDDCMLVSDDRHAEDLIRGHINLLVEKCVQLGIDFMTAIKCVTLNPMRHYNLRTGAIQPKMFADIIITDTLKEFRPKSVYIDGKLVASKSRPLFDANPVNIDEICKKKKEKILRKISPSDFVMYAKGPTVDVRTIEIIKDQIITREVINTLKVKNNQILPNIQKDIIKIGVVNRYRKAPVSKAFISGFSLKTGALASSVAHDSHNIIVVGVDDKNMASAANIALRGGLVAISENKKLILDLPIVGLMSTKKADVVVKKLKKLNEFVKSLGCTLDKPFVTLSFMSLLVIPELKLSDKGLFRNDNFVSPVIKM